MANPKCSPYMTEFLNYIADNMIVADKSKRDRSPIVKKRLYEFLQKCETTGDYALKPISAVCVPDSGSSDVSSDPQRRRNSAAQNKEQPMMSHLTRWTCFWMILSVGVVPMSHLLRSWTGV